MKYNYPIKYCVISVSENNDLHGEEKKSDSIGYIVSKCYIVKHTTYFSRKGETKKMYEVVLPFESINNIFKRITPDFDLDGRCINSIKVKDVFSSYVEAVDVADKNNAILCQNMYSILPFSEDLVEQIAKKKTEFYDNLFKYKVLEREMLKLTEDMEVNKISYGNNVIVFSRGEGKVLDADLYSYINYLFVKNQLVAYTLSEKDYNKLKIQVNLNNASSDENSKKIKYNIDHSNLLLVNSPDLEHLKIINPLSPNKNSGYYLDYNEKLGYDESLKEVEIDDIDIQNFNGLIVYTTETFEDVIHSYKKFDDIDLIELQKGPMFQKKMN